MILSVVLPWMIGLLAVSLLLAGYRLVIGPGLADRILALDTLYINVCALLVMVGIYFGTSLFFEAALLIGMLGFVGTVVLSKFILRGDIAE